jgi:pimeloyl-ACP methyl ester carboxylesterase
MSLWTDFIGAELRFVATPSFGRTRIVEAGRGHAQTVILMHGVGGHLEAYAKNVIALSDEFHVIAYDFPGHGQSSHDLPDFSPALLARHLAELMDVLGVTRAHLSGESLGGWVAGVFATVYPERVARLVLNTSAGIPIVSVQGQQDLQELITLSARNASQPPTTESVTARMRWLMHESNWGLLTDELIATRLTYYRDPGTRRSGPVIGRFMTADVATHLIDLSQLACETLFLWTRHNPIHDLAAATAACARVAQGQVYVMQAQAAHWPQYEAPAEFNTVFKQFLKDGTV